MSFDALTIAGILFVLSGGGFVIALVSRNDILERKPSRPAQEEIKPGADSG